MPIVNVGVQEFARIERHKAGVQLELYHPAACGPFIKTAESALGSGASVENLWKSCTVAQ